MNQKLKITKYLVEQNGFSTDHKSIKKFISLWWQNPRIKNIGGLKLTDEGFAEITRHFTPHKIRFDTKIEYTSQLIIRLDNFITCPWYTLKKDLYVFDDKMAVQLLLFSGDIVKFSEAKAKSKSLLTTAQN